MSRSIMFTRPGINPLCYIVERQYQRNYVIKPKLFSERLASARNLYRKDLFAHYGCVNAIEFSKEGELLISGGDDRRVLLWSLPKIFHGNAVPVAMHTNHLSNIFCLDFNSSNSRIFSGGNDDQAIVHDVNTRYLVVRLPHKKPVYGLNVNPHNDNILATAGDDGRILLYDLRETPNSDAVQCLAKQKTGFHSVMFNPRNPRWLTTANSEEGIALWDCRKPREQLIHFDSGAGAISGISACFNSTGSHILALRRRLPPVLYATQKENAVCQFYHPQYYNSCTMKTCCFAGEDDEYILSGSDDFNLYMWNIPKTDAEWASTHLVLKGHRSIVNQVRYNKQNNLVASSGVEKMVKLWSTLPIGTWKGSLTKEQSDSIRSVYTHEEYIYLVGSAGERISHDYSEHSTQEDSKMMAFFDSLIQREIEGWNSSDNPSDVSDSDSDNSSPQDYNNLSKEMFVNLRNSNDENKKQKTNKIAQLIAKKRDSLAKMAHAKSSTSVQRNNKVKDICRKHNGFQKYKSSKQKHNSFTKRSLGKQPSSEKESKKHKLITERSKLKKYRTRQSLREICDNTNNSLDAPSTSTGITSSHNNLFRVIEQDSEEDIPPNGCVENGNAEEGNLVNILPTPINGTHDMFINVLEMTTNIINGDSGSSRDDSAINRASTSRQNRYRYDSAICIDGGPEHATSSNGTPSRFPRSSFNGSYPPMNLNGNNTDSDSDYEYNYVTPVKKRRISASDSGCGTGPCSSMSSYLKNSRNHQECSNNNNNNTASCSSEDELNYENFRKRVKKARLNMRKQIAAESDSN